MTYRDQTKQLESLRNEYTEKSWSQ
jgi:hypothetical protein